MRIRRLLSLLLAAGLLAVLSGCTSRGLTITSVPPGAEIAINHRVVGVTPIRVNFTHYGAYEIELRKDRYQTLVREETISPPWYGYDPMTFVADNVIPARINDEIFIHYVMTPVQEMDRDAILARANRARDGFARNPRTGEEMKIEFEVVGEYRKAPRTPLGPQEKQEPELIGPAPSPQLQVPEAKPERPEDKPPEGPRIEPGPAEPQPESAPAPEKPAPKPEPAPPPVEAPETKEEPKTETRMRRTPQGEVLIYEETPLEDPIEKK